MNISIFFFKLMMMIHFAYCWLCFQPYWIPLHRKKPPSVPFISEDGFDLYIDGCRHLPDSVTISRVYNFLTFLMVKPAILHMKCIRCTASLNLLLRMQSTCLQQKLVQLCSFLGYKAVLPMVHDLHMQIHPWTKSNIFRCMPFGDAFLLREIHLHSKAAFCAHCSEVYVASLQCCPLFFSSSVFLPIFNTYIGC